MCGRHTISSPAFLPEPCFETMRADFRTSLFRQRCRVRRLRRPLAYPDKRHVWTYVIRPSTLFATSGETSDGRVTVSVGTNGHVTGNVVHKEHPGSGDARFSPHCGENPPPFPNATRNGSRHRRPLSRKRLSHSADSVFERSLVVPCRTGLLATANHVARSQKSALCRESLAGGSEAVARRAPPRCASLRT